MPRRADAGCALDTYLSEIREHPLLDREQEIDLARRIRAGDQEALDRLVSANLRFVVSIARRYARRGVSLEELVNEGNLGLIRAARRFDGSRGVRFLSYAVWWIRQSILDALSREASVVRMPASRGARLRRIVRARREVERRTRRPASLAEIAAETGIPEWQVANLLSMRRGDVSLDQPVVDETGPPLHELLADHAAGPAVVADREAVLGALLRDLGLLSDREAEILKRHFGLDGSPPETMSEIGRSMGLGSARVRTLKRQALSRLRQASERS